jgi:hypothetical protein
MPFSMLAFFWRDGKDVKKTSFPAEKLRETAAVDGRRPVSIIFQFKNLHFQFSTGDNGVKIKQIGNGKFGALSVVHSSFLLTE